MTVPPPSGEPTGTDRKSTSDRLRAANSWARAQARALKFEVFQGPSGTIAAWLLIVIFGLSVIYGGWKLARSSEAEAPATIKPKLAIVGPSTPEGAPGHSDWVPVESAIRTYLDKSDVHALIDTVWLNDRGDTALAASRAAQLCSDSSVIAVVGYVWSSVAKTAISEYAKCQLPVILVGATDDDLTGPNSPTWTTPILQVAATNHFQAMAIAQGLGDTFGADSRPTVTVLWDPDNPRYSEALGRQIMAAANEYKKARYKWRFQQYGGESWSEVARDRRGAPDAVIFVGNTDNAKLLLRDRPSKDTTIAIFTDGAVNPSLLLSSAECVWGTFPSRGGHEQNAGPSYADFGAEAVGLVEGWVLRQKRRDITREALRSYVRSLSFNAAVIELAGQHVQFDSRGRIARRLSADDAFWGDLYMYHFLQVRKRRGGDVGWEHRERRSELSRCSE